MFCCDYAYPTAAQANTCGVYLFQMVAGQVPKDVACAAHCAYTLEGYALSLGLPDAHPMFSASGSAEDQLKSLLSGFDKEDHTMKAVPWKNIAVLVLQLVLNWLQAPVPPVPVPPHP